MVFSVWTDFAAGGGGGAGVLAVLAVLSSALRNVLMSRKRTTTDFFINPPFAWWEGRAVGNYNNSDSGYGFLLARSLHLGKFLFNFVLPLTQLCEASVPLPLIQNTFSLFYAFCYFQYGCLKIATRLQNRAFCS